MTRREYERLQERLSEMKDSKRLFDKGVSGKRKEGYEAAILAVKSMLKDEFYRQEDQESKRLPADTSHERRLTNGKPY